MSDEIKYVLAAYNSDGQVIAKATSHIDIDDVTAESDHIMEQVDEYLFQLEQIDYDDMAKHERIIAEDL